MVQETGIAGLFSLLFEILCRGLIELAGSDDSGELSSTGHSVGIVVIATGCSGSSGWYPGL